MLKLQMGRRDLLRRSRGVERTRKALGCIARIGSLHHVFPSFRRVCISTSDIYRNALSTRNIWMSLMPIVACLSSMPSH